MVFEAERHTGSQREAICSVAEELGPTAETVCKWVRRVEIDEGHRPGLTTDERDRLKVLERENRELRGRPTTSHKRDGRRGHASSILLLSMDQPRGDEVESLEVV